MKKKEITQGSVITNIRSLKYPNFPCYGIVINARCDFAQDKIQNFYLLSALPIKQWINEVLVDEIFEIDVVNKKKKLLEEAKKHDADITSFYMKDKKEFYDRVGSIDGISKEVQNNLKALHTALQDAISLLKKSQSEKKNKITKNKLKDQLRNLYTGKVSNRCFIPEKSYSTNSINAIASHIREAVSMSSENANIPYEMLNNLRLLSISLDSIAREVSDESNLTDGLVVDLFDIIPLSMQLKSSIESGEYTKDTLPNELQHLFVLDSDEQQVHVETIVSSPYVEYIMQHFSNAFVRIGIDNASDTQILQFCDEIMNEWKGATT